MNSRLLAVVRCLSFAAGRTGDLGALGQSEWKSLLPLCDRAQLTLPLALRAIQQVPGWVRQRLERNLANNAVRYAGAVAAYREIAAAFAAHGVEYLVLKGFSHYPHYCQNLRHRPQYDLDFYCPPASLQNALRAVTELGYEPFRRVHLPADHLPPLIRKTGWRPGSDYFDPAMPFTVELHYRFWDSETERFHTCSAEALWARRVTEKYESLEFPALSPEDRLAYAAWHLVRHLLRGELRAYHVYEIAHFLNATAADDAWWCGWARGCSGSNVEGVAFRLARDWFQCRLHPVAEHLIAGLPGPIHRWFEEFSFSPLLAWEHPNKDELFLHLCLLQGLQNRLSVLRRRLIPLRFQPPVLDAHVPSPGRSLRWKRSVVGLWFIVRRAVYHAWALIPLMRSAIRWRRALARRPD